MACGAVWVTVAASLFCGLFGVSKTCPSLCVCFNINICDDLSITETRISLISRGITYIPPFAFRNHTNVTYLVVSGDAVTSVDGDAFQGLGSLEVLILSNNGINSLPSGLFTGLFSLTRLSLVMNQLSDLPDGIFSDLTKLERLDLRFNNLLLLPAGVIHGVPYSALIELEGNPINCSCSLVHILNYTLSDSTLCYYPWQQRQKQLASLNATQLCTVFPPTTPPLGTTASSARNSNGTKGGVTTHTSASDLNHTSPSQQPVKTDPAVTRPQTDVKNRTDAVTTTLVTTDQQLVDTGATGSAKSTVSTSTKREALTTLPTLNGTDSTTVSDIMTDSMLSFGTGDYYRHVLMTLATGPISENNAASVVDQITDLVSDPRWLNSSDVDELTTLLEKALTLSTSQALLDNIVLVTNYLMDLELPVLQDTHRDSKASSRLVILLEDYVEYTMLTSDLYDLSVSHSNLALEAVRVRPSDFTGMGVVALDADDDNWLKRSSTETNETVNGDGVRASVFIPADALQDPSGTNEEVIILFVVYRNSKLFSSAIENEWEATDRSGTYRVNSLIVSCRFGRMVVQDLPTPISLTFSHNQPGVDPLCSWWNFDKKPFDDWSQAGCRTKELNIINRTLCLCYHATNFALLMDLSSQLEQDSGTSEVHDKTLAILSYVGCALSTFGLCLTVITLLYFRQLRQKMANKLLVNLCLALLLVVAIFAGGISRTDYAPICRAVAALLHFSLLAALMWMGAEAVNLYLTVVQLKTASSGHYLVLCMGTCWGLPAVVVAVCLGTSLDDYGGSKYCWIQEGVFFAGFLVPALAVIVFNCGVFVMVLHSLKDARPNRGTFFSTALLRLRVSFAAMVMLGLTWSFGALTVGDARLVFQYLFVICNSVQGFLIFVVHCLGKPEVRKAWRGRRISNRETEVKINVEKPVGGIQYRTPSGRMTWKALEESPSARNSQDRSGSKADIAVNRETL